MSVLYKVELEEDDVLLLRKSNNSKIIDLIENIERSRRFRRKYGLTDIQSKFVSDLLEELKKEGRLIFRRVLLSYCKYSKKSAGYAKYKRTSKNHIKGQTDYSRPLVFSGVEFASRFIIVKHRACLGCSLEFWNEIKDIVYQIFKDIDLAGEISENMFGEKSKYKRYDNVKCTKCNWEGHEGQMGELPRLIGSSYYRGICPDCGVKNTFGVTNVKTVDGFTIVESSNPKQIVHVEIE
jgi:hypothetical protein